MHCERHGLVADASGSCVVCRREDAPPPRLLGPVGVVSLLIVAGGLAAGGLSLARRQRAAERSARAVAERIEEGHAMEARAAEEERRAAAPFESPPTRGFIPPPSTRVVASARVPAADRVVADGGAPAADATAATDRAEEARKKVAREEAIGEGMRRVPITLYGTSWCPACRSARQWLSDNHYSVSDYDIEASPTAKQECRQRNPRGSVPTIVIGDQVIVGFSASSVTGALRAAAAKRLD